MGISVRVKINLIDSSPNKKKITKKKNQHVHFNLEMTDSEANQGC